MTEAPGSGESSVDAIVECYSGYAYAQEPRAVVWQGQRLAVTAIDSRWRTPQGPAFWVSTESGKSFELHYDQAEDLWSIRRIEGT